jgi:hypothetical protein
MRSRTPAGQLVSSDIAVTLAKFKRYYIIIEEIKPWRAAIVDEKELSLRVRAAKSQGLPRGGSSGLRLCSASAIVWMVLVVVSLLSEAK